MRKRVIPIFMFKDVWRWVIRGWRKPIYEIHYYGEFVERRAFLGYRDTHLVKWSVGWPGIGLKGLIPSFLKSGTVMASRTEFDKWKKNPPMVFVEVPALFRGGQVKEAYYPEKMEIVSEEEAALIMFSAEGR